MFQSCLGFAKRLLTVESVMVLTFLVVMTLCLPQVASAQSESGSASLKGRIVDPSGGAIKAAAVVIKNESTGFVSKSTADEEGRFSGQAHCRTFGNPGGYTKNY